MPVCRQQCDASLINTHARARARAFRCVVVIRTALPDAAIKNAEVVVNRLVHVSFVITTVVLVCLQLLSTGSLATHFYFSRVYCCHLVAKCGTI